MQALKPTQFTGRVTWLGVVADSGDDLRAAPLAHAELSFAGIAGECHGGLTRPACSRTALQYPRGTEIRNVRQLSVLSAEELAGIAAEMGLQRLDPAMMGASLVVEGIPDFTLVPPGARLQFESGAAITVDMQNLPCKLPARVIERAHEGFGKAFVPAARQRRGVTAWVEREGPVGLGDALRLHVPGQPVWPHLEAARAD